VTYVQTFWRLSLKQQNELLAIIFEGCKWRGWDRLNLRDPDFAATRQVSNPSHAEVAINEFADRMRDHGYEIEEYT
jgi:hypothetical protein